MKTYLTNKTDEELAREQAERDYIEYLKLFFISSLLIGLCLIAAGHITKAVDQEFGIYKTNTKARAF